MGARIAPGRGFMGVCAAILVREALPRTLAAIAAPRGANALSCEIYRPRIGRCRSNRGNAHDEERTQTP